MSPRTIFFTIVATSLAACAAHAQTLTPVSITHQGEAFARYDWLDPLTPDSIATDFVSGSGLGDSLAAAVPSNLGISGVNVESRGRAAVALNGGGHAVVVLGQMAGHTNLPAFVDASFASTATMVFDIDQTALVSLDCTFQNFSLPKATSPGIGGGQATTSLTGPGGQAVFSFANSVTSQNPISFTEFLTLQPGQYTLTVQSSGSMNFAFGYTDYRYTSYGIVIINVPSPGGVALLILLGFAGPRRRR